MITIFNGRRLSLTGTQDDVYVQVSVALRQHLHKFNSGRSLNPFGVFMVIALHADSRGWAWPSQDMLSAETGITTRRAISDAVAWLLAMRLEEQRILEAYRERRADGAWGRTAYRIFPDAFTDGLAAIPRTDGTWTPWRMADDEPCSAEPRMAEQCMVQDPLSITSVKREPEGKYSALPAELDFTAGTQTPAAPTPRRLLGDNGHPPDRRRARVLALNADLAPNLRIPLADAILAETGLTALADVPDENGDRALNGAHTTAVTLYRMGITTPAALAQVVAAWRGTWQGKEGQPPTNQQLIAQASVWRATHVHPPAVASDTAAEPALPETFPGMEPDHASHRVTRDRQP